MRLRYYRQFDVPVALRLLSVASVRRADTQEILEPGLGKRPQYHSFSSRGTKFDASYSSKFLTEAKFHRCDVGRYIFSPSRRLCQHGLSRCCTFPFDRTALCLGLGYPKQFYSGRTLFRKKFYKTAMLWWNDTTFSMAQIQIKPRLIMIAVSVSVCVCV